MSRAHGEVSGVDGVEGCKETTSLRRQSDLILGGQRRPHSIERSTRYPVHYQVTPAIDISVRDHGGRSNRERPIDLLKDALLLLSLFRVPGRIELEHVLPSGGKDRERACLEEHNVIGANAELAP